MKKSGLRHTNPLSIPRRGGTRLIEGKSPKLGRRVRLFDYAIFAIWVGLEAQPEVVTFCEYPLRIGAAAQSPVIDFWVQGDSQEEYLVSPVHPSSIEWPVAVNGVNLLMVSDAELAATSRWVQNWEFILSTLNGQDAISDASRLTKQILSLVDRPTPLAEIERRFVASGTPVVRASIFHLLRIGKLRAPSLRDQSLSNLTLFEPV